MHAGGTRSRELMVVRRLSITPYFENDVGSSEFRSPL